MGIQNIDGALINIDDKQLWYIYNYNDQLEYRIFNDQKTASDNKIIAQNLIQGFSADVNALGRIHLVCHSPSGNVFYFHFNGQQWDKQLLTKYDPLRYTMKHPVMKLYNNDIHIFFAMGNLYNSADWALYHYLWHNGQWQTLKIGSINLGRLIGQFQVAFAADNSIHLIYRDKDQKGYKIYHSSFDSAFKIWSSPIPITPDNKSPGYSNFVIYNNAMHLVWNNIYKNHISVEYAAVPLEKSESKQIKKSAIISPEGIDAMHPIIGLLNNELWVTWINNGHIYSTYSDDDGHTWHNGDAVQLPENKEAQCFGYIDRKFPSVNLVYGYIDEIPRLVPPMLQQTLSPHESQLSATVEEKQSIPITELDDRDIITIATDKIAQQISDVKARQADLLQLLIKADRQYQEITDTLERLDQLNNDIKANGLRKSGIVTVLKKWLSK